MINYIEAPNLPKNAVKDILLGEKYRKILEIPLKKYGLSPIWLPDNPFVDERLSGHADLSAVHLGKNRLAVAEYALNCEQINNLGFELIKLKNQENEAYPDDAIYNVCVAGKHLIVNEKTADQTLLEYFNDKDLISCRQGYSKCSVCVVNENSIITSDKGIALKAEKSGMDVLIIKERIVRLDGFESGFIGGASFKISRNEMAFTGEVKDRGQRTLIEHFLAERDIKVIYLTDNEIFDIGSAIPLTEYTNTP